MREDIEREQVRLAAQLISCQTRIIRFEGILERRVHREGTRFSATRQRTGEQKDRIAPARIGKCDSWMLAEETPQRFGHERCDLFEIELLHD